jgi:flagellar biosynthesis/type III secretory pathway protein FliH
MKMISLPSGKFINPAHVDSIKVHSHSLSWSKFYVQMSLKEGSTEDIAESLDHEKALALQKEYVALVHDSHTEAEPYWHGYDEGYEKGSQTGRDEGYKKGQREGHDAGYEKGRREGYEAGKTDGYRSGYDAGIASAGHRERLLARVYEFREELMTEQQNDSAMTPDRRRYLQHSISAITDLIARL